MKTAIVLPSGCAFAASRPNSMETVVRTLARHSARPDLLILCDAGATDHGDLPVRTLTPAAGRRRRAAELAVALGDFAPDCIEFHQQIGIAAQLGPAFPDCARLLYRHNAIKAPGHAIDRLRYGLRYAPFEGFVFVSDAARHEFAGAYPRLADRAFAVRNPIDVTGWTAPVEGRDPLIAFAGRAMREKGVDVLCAALGPVLDRHRDWRAVLMLGDWEQHEGWVAPHVARLARYGRRVEVRRSASLGEVQQVMARAAIAVTPSVWAEPLGLAALEAHAAGAALISSGRGGLREASGANAVYLDAVTPEAIERAIEGLIRDPARRLQLARDGQAFVRREHAPAVRAAELDALRMRLVDEKRGRRLPQAA